MRLRTENCKDVKGVSEVIGAMLLVVIAVVASAAIYNYVLSQPLPSPETHVKLMGYVVNESGTLKVIIDHMGGEPLRSYKIIAMQADGRHVYPEDGQPCDTWRIGEPQYPEINLPLFERDKSVSVTVVALHEDGSEQVVFEGVLTPEGDPVYSENPGEQGIPTDPMLNSTLRTDTDDEDLICYSYSVNTTIPPTTYVYNWSKGPPGGSRIPLTWLLLPFDTNSQMMAKDYSGNENNGTITGASWTNQGKVGGAYSFLGNECITLPYIFSSPYIDKITVEAWIKTSLSSGTILSFDRTKYWDLAVANGHVKWSTNSTDHVADSTGNLLVNDDQWHLVAATYNSTSGDCKIYVDGLLDTSTNAHPAGSLLGSGSMPFGAIGKGTGVASAQTIFSTGFETQDEKNQWAEHNGTGGQQQTWTNLRYDNFNSGWGSYTDGDGSGSDCYRTSSYKHEGTYSACLRDNSGTYSSFSLTNGVDIDSPGYKSLKIDFWWMWNGVGWSSNEDWWLRYYNGATWVTVLDVNYPSGFSKDVWYHRVVYINETDYTFPTGMKIRFQCDAYDDNDRVYFDQIYINASSWGRIESDFALLPSTALNPRTGSYSLGGSGDFDPEYCRYNRTSINIANYTNVQVSLWYSYKNAQTTDFFGLYYKNNSLWNPIFEIPSPQTGGQTPWTHVTINVPRSLTKLVLQFKWRTSSTSEYMAIDDLEITGVPRAGENNFTGIIDEVRIYRRVLSAEQIYQNYLCSKDGISIQSVIVSEETLGGENWQCYVTPNHVTGDDVAVPSYVHYINDDYHGWRP